MSGGFRYGKNDLLKVSRRADYVPEDDDLDRILIRRSKQPTPEQQEDYLVLLSEGTPHFTAAKQVGSTGTTMRRYRERDRRFGRLAEAAESLQPVAREDRVRACLWEVITDVDHPKHWEAVKFAAEVYLTETQYKRVRQTQSQIDVMGALATTLHMSIEALHEMPENELDGLIAMMEKLQATPRVALPETT